MSALGTQDQAVGGETAHHVGRSGARGSWLPSRAQPLACVPARQPGSANEPVVMAAQVVVRTGDAAAVVVEVLVAACCPAVEWREKNRSGGGRVIPETAETAETDLRDSGKDQAGGGHGVLMQARARRAERTISRASISPCHRGQPRAADRGQPTSPWRCWSPAAALGVGETDAGPRRRCALPSGGAWAAPRELVG